MSDYPIYTFVSDFTCYKCKKYHEVKIIKTTRGEEENNYCIMQWEGNTYCAGCALEMKEEKIVIDKEIIIPDYSKGEKPLIIRKRKK